jgi:hypothetical protein
LEGAFDVDVEFDFGEGGYEGGDGDCVHSGWFFIARSLVM